jgi:hypothetical protein
MSDEVLGDLNAACARDDDETTEHIARLARLTPRTVQKRLSEAHGATLVRNVFADVWPTTAGALAEIHVKQAREAGLFAEIARVTGLTERTVRRRLEEAHGKGFLQNLFSDAWPSKAGEDEAPASDGDAEDGRFAIGDLTAARARRNEDLVQRIAVLTGHGVRAVQRRLENAHGAARVRNIFREWPTDAQQLGDLRVKLARECRLFPEIAAITHQSEQTVFDRLMQGDGRSAVRNLFGSMWPSGGTNGEEQEDEDVNEDEEHRDEDDGDEENVTARFRLDPDGAWSRPRQLARVLRLLDIQVPLRLRDERFREALQLLARAGIEACIASDGERTVLSLDADTPGIHAEIRLRIATEPTRRTPPPTRGPETSPPPPIVVVSRPARPAPPPPPRPREPAYDTALRRLQFLTAVPSMDRQHEPEWPDGYLKAATAGLEVTPFEVRHLRMVAASLVKGHHSPEGIITRLLKVETPGDLEALVTRFRHLNHSMLENAEEVVQWMGVISAGYPSVAHPQPYAPPPARAPVASAAPPPAHRSPTPAPTVKLATQETHTNVRDLGALDDMFKD